MQKIAAVLSGKKGTIVCKRSVVEGSVIRVPEYKYRDCSCGAPWIQVNPEKSTPMRALSKRVDVPGVSVCVVSRAEENVRKLDPGRNFMFSGRLNGVARAIFAAALASKESMPSVAVSCTVTQRTGYELPGVCSLSCRSE